MNMSMRVEVIPSAKNSSFLSALRLSKGMTANVFSPVLLLLLEEKRKYVPIARASTRSTAPIVYFRFLEQASLAKKQLDVCVAMNPPASVASFVGANNFLPLDQHPALVAGLKALSLLPKVAVDHPDAVAAVRPEKLVVGRTLASPGLQLTGALQQAMFTGTDLQLTVEVPGLGVLEALTAPSEAMVALQPGDPVPLTLAAADILYYAAGELGALLS